jgi:NADPH-dependent 2,4-dienoyl-CoA reductase/sulfur reductase-like enzyme/nitrite reductase/ring-hydroxylating ferredoxin subunit
MASHKLGAESTLLKDGEMKRVEIDGKGILLARQDGQYYAIGADCSHYGGPLNEGVLMDHTVMCPWHHACFDIRNGRRMEPPALDDVSQYTVKIEGGEVVLSMAEQNEVEPEGSTQAADPRQVVIVGGGAAGNAAAEELRRNGFAGKITILSSVPDVPVDRPNLSKDYLAGEADPSWIPLRGDASWYAERDITLRLETTVSKIDTNAHSIQLANGEMLTYDKLLLATGGVPRQLDKTPGHDLKGIYTLRSLGDADKIIKEAEEGKRAVIIGASFIGMEAAAALAGGRKLKVTVVGLEKVPFDRILGEEIGRVFQAEHEKNGVEFRLSAEVARFVGKDGSVSSIELKAGEVLEADFVVVGVGVRPATDFLRESGLKLHERDQSVLVSDTLQSSAPDVYAAGDIARWDDGAAGVRIEHWRTAEQQGIVAARNMLGRAEVMLGHVPFFWTNQWKIALRYVGHAEKWDEIIYRYGKPETKDFIAFYVQGGKLLAAAGMNRDTEMDAIEFILKAQKPLSVEVRQARQISNG